MIHFQQYDGPMLTALDKNGILVQLAAVKASNGSLQIVMTATNNSTDTLDQYLFQVCVAFSPFLIYFKTCSFRLLFQEVSLCK